MTAKILNTVKVCPKCHKVVYNVSVTKCPNCNVTLLFKHFLEGV